MLYEHKRYIGKGEWGSVTPPSGEKRTYRPFAVVWDFFVPHYGGLKLVVYQQCRESARFKWQFYVAEFGKVIKGFDEEVKSGDGIIACSALRLNGRKTDRTMFELTKSLNRGPFKTFEQAQNAGFQTVVEVAALILEKILLKSEGGIFDGIPDQSWADRRG